ncbi:MAG: hypothetical protein VXW66_05745 [Pseudomonadota bacterium]|nr:hypothetical protein [Pseudomonadota bacterium]
MEDPFNSKMGLLHPIANPGNCRRAGLVKFMPMVHKTALRLAGNFCDAGVAQG